MSVIEGRYEQSHYGWRLVIQVAIRPLDEPFKLEMARAVIDTGASRTAITDQIAARLKLVPRGKKLVRSARDENYHTLYDFDLGFVIDRAGSPTYEFPGDHIQGMEWAGHPDFDVLLGMDVISQTDLTLRRDRTFSLIIG